MGRGRGCRRVGIRLGGGLGRGGMGVFVLKEVGGFKEEWERVEKGKGSRRGGQRGSRLE